MRRSESVLLPVLRCGLRVVICEGRNVLISVIRIGKVDEGRENRKENEDKTRRCECLECNRAMRRPSVGGTRVLCVFKSGLCIRCCAFS